MTINRNPTLGDVRRMEMAKPADERGKTLVLRQEEPETRNQFHNNSDFVENLLNFSPFGGLGQVFVIEAIRHYSAAVEANDPGPEDPDFEGPVSPQLWRRIATDVSSRTKQHLKTT